MSIPPLQMRHRVRLIRAHGATCRCAMLLLLAVVGCYTDPETARWGRGEAVGQMIVQQVDRASAGGTVNVADLSPFRWERLHLFPSGSAAALVRDSLGIEWVGAERGGAARQSESTLFVFSGAGDVLAATMVPTSLVGVAPELVGRGYAPHEATFRVELTLDGRRRLVP